MKNFHVISKVKAALYPAVFALLCGGIAACSDDYKLDDDGVSPNYISIYSSLENPSQTNMTGSFKYYLRLIDDLGYKETLQRTGSKTIFPANDEAFDRFFQSNDWGVTSYDQLTVNQKKLLLYGSMLDNAILTNMLSNVPSGGANGQTVTRGQAMKHNTTINVIDTITHLYGPASMPANNKYWEKYYDHGIDIVTDATRPMMVHLTQSQMAANNITLSGDNSDFEVITGYKFENGGSNTYIYRDPVIVPDVTCLNGYIHQVKDVLVPPGNVAQMLNENPDASLFMRMLDRFSEPVYTGQVTNNYNDYAILNGEPLIDSIFQKRYFSSRSQGGQPLNTDVNYAPVSNLLNYDPGWNGYTPTSGNQLSDIFAMFVPTNEALEKFFLPGGSGAFLIDAFGKKPNTRENLEENIDSIRIDVVSQFLNNLMKPSFVATVPSKFGSITNDASEPMGLSLDVLNKTADGRYDVRIGDNGVAYMLNTVISPDQFQSVYAPTLFSDNMKIMLSAINDGQHDQNLGLNLNFYAYLLAMKANYALFLPTDSAFHTDQWYVDPTFLKHDQPRVLHFYIAEPMGNNRSNVWCSAWEYNPNTHEVGDSMNMAPLAASAFKTQLTDILNYHTIVLAPGEEFGVNKYYKTKHGGEIKYENGTVVSGAQVENGLAPAKVINTYNERNGKALVIDHVIQPTENSVYSVLADSVNFPQFSEFYNLCTDSRMDEIMGYFDPLFLGTNPVTKKPNTDRYHVFAAGNGLTDNVNYFNSYNYTVYAPDNAAMDEAYSKGLPSWDDIEALYNQAIELEMDTAEMDWAREEWHAIANKGLAMIESINAFERYHFQNVSIYVDNEVRSDNQTALGSGTEFNTAYSSVLGVKLRLKLTGGSNQFSVEDLSGKRITIGNNNSLAKNIMTRDYVFNNAAATASAINTSSFAVVHEINTPLCPFANGRYDGEWTGANAKKKLAEFRKNFDYNLKYRH